jgi:hypothetical protein
MGIAWRGTCTVEDDQRKLQLKQRHEVDFYVCFKLKSLTRHRFFSLSVEAVHLGRRPRKQLSGLAWPDINFYTPYINHKWNVNLTSF